MSESDDGGFDKEAEREKLRKKFEEQEESRQATQHMSDLLLKGATMTNSHCAECGDPIFRKDGQEFCPTCGEIVEEEEADEPIDVPSESGEGSGESAATSATDQGVAGAAGATAAGGSTPPGASHGEQTGPGAEATRTNEADTGRTAPQPNTGGANEQPRQAAGRAAGGLGEARASLVRTLGDLARQAEEAEDVRRTRDLLAAAREAAEAVAALDRADR